jgi:hypothetical protein
LSVKSLATRTFAIHGPETLVVGSKASSTQQSSPCGPGAAVLPFIYLWPAFLANLAATAAFRTLANAQRLLVAGATRPPASPERVRAGSSSMENLTVRSNPYRPVIEHLHPSAEGICRNPSLVACGLGLSRRFRPPPRSVPVSLREFLCNRTRSAA